MFILCPSSVCDTWPQTEPRISRKIISAYSVLAMSFLFLAIAC